MEKRFIDLSRGDKIFKIETKTDDIAVLKVIGTQVSSGDLVMTFETKEKYEFKCIFPYHCLLGKVYNNVNYLFISDPEWYLHTTYELLDQSQNGIIDLYIKTYLYIKNLEKQLYEGF